MIRTVRKPLCHGRVCKSITKTDERESVCSKVVATFSNKVNVVIDLQRLIKVLKFLSQTL